MCLLRTLDFNIIGAVNISLVVSHIDNIGDRNYSVHHFPTVLIGIGVMKTGSTYFLDALSNSNHGLNVTLMKLQNNQTIFTSLISNRSNKQISFLQPQSDQKNSGELKYWTWCSFDHTCSFEDYIHSNWNFRQQDHVDGHNKIVLIEKSPTYIKEPHTAMLLGHYSNIAPIKIYISLRNPVHRLWSHYWYICYNNDENVNCNKGDIVQQIENDIASLGVHYPDWYKMMRKIEKSDKNMDDDEYILELYAKGFYSMNNLMKNRDAIITSCYFPQIKMWTKNMDWMKNDNLKIFEYEDMVLNISNIIYQIRRWINKDSDYYAQIPIDRDKILRRERKLKYIDQSRNKEIIPESLKITLQQLFKGCNDRLRKFIMQNDQLLLLQSSNGRFMETW